MFSTVVTVNDVDWLVLNYLHQIAGDWELFLGQLGMPRPEVKQISGVNNVALKCLADGLEFWVNVSARPTYERISQVLRGTVVINFPLAKKVEEFAKGTFLILKWTIVLVLQSLPLRWRSF